MFFVNLSLGEFVALLGAVSSIVTALYLLDRAKRKKIVSTLRFWVDARRVEERQRRQRVREPWSLLLQLLSLLLLLLAIAQLHWGSREQLGSDHVLLLDTSAWMAQRTANGTLLNSAKRLAWDYVQALPSRDRVMLVRADGLTTPVAGFTDDRKQLRQTIAAARASYSALNLKQALDMAVQAARWSGGGGEVVYVGPGRIADRDEISAAAPRLRVLPVRAQDRDAGIRHVGVRRAEGSADTWEASVAVRNYDAAPRTLALHLRFGATEFAPRLVSLAGGEEKNLSYRFTTSSAGTLTATLVPGDALATDDHASLALPSPGALRVAVFTNRPNIVRPIFEADGRLAASYFRPAEYAAQPDADVMVLDGFAPPLPPRIPALWIHPPAGNSPVPVVASESAATLTSWDSRTELGAGLHSKELRLAQTDVFASGPNVVPIAGIDRGPVVVAVQTTPPAPRMGIIGFDPFNGELRYELATPLMFANLVRWLAPESFRVVDLTADAVGTVEVALDASEPESGIRVLDDRGFSVPFTIHNHLLELYAGRPGVIRVLSAERERVLSLTLPGIAQYRWRAPALAPRGLPGATVFGSPALDLWKWLAFLGGLGLLAEWLFYGAQRPWKRRAPPVRLTRESEAGHVLVEK